MESIRDTAGDARRAWLSKMQDGFVPIQSDFERSLAFRLSLIVAAVVIGLSLFSPPPTPAHLAVRSTV